MSSLRFPPLLTRRRLLVLLPAAAAVLLGLFFSRADRPAPPPEAQSVRTAKAVLMDFPLYFHGIGIVTPENTVLVTSRVDGELIAIHFTEGQDVLAGDLLAEIDPRPFEIRLKEAEGALARDTALLTDARLDLERYRGLIRREAVSAQQLQAQEALVGQYEGAARVDEANIADARLQLSFCRITAPISGRLGLRQADLGNMIRTSDATGLVVITQMQPMHVVFTLTEKQVPDVLSAMRSGPRPVEAWDQDNRTLLASGLLVTLDNRIDSATGTVKAKAVFDNSGERLFPNQFVNARLLVATIPQALVVPASAVQRNSDGFFVYVVASDDTVAMRPVRTGQGTSVHTRITEGLSAGEVVVTDGVDRLRNGIKVTVE
ncbi:MAG: MdtA/MuxA family multidrug efflux RND transporter periplasmic adaptor subunit [Desulfovibrio sp.]|jgi:multidrug efflux system membrane fusion protein|nr:MdtA/MuxA family multidrug efflux RND transporter periplasmic adaptor subunit [Desulfovibrio sp.]